MRICPLDLKIGAVKHSGPDFLAHPVDLYKTITRTLEMQTQAVLISFKEKLRVISRSQDPLDTVAGLR